MDDDRGNENDNDGEETTKVSGCSCAGLRCRTTFDCEEKTFGDLKTTLFCKMSTC